MLTARHAIIGEGVTVDLTTKETPMKNVNSTNAWWTLTAARLLHVALRGAWILANALAMQNVTPPITVEFALVFLVSLVIHMALHAIQVSQADDKL